MEKEIMKEVETVEDMFVEYNKRTMDAVLLKYINGYIEYAENRCKDYKVAELNRKKAMEIHKLAQQLYIMESIIKENYTPMIDCFCDGKRTFYLKEVVNINDKIVIRRVEYRLILPHHDKIAMIGFENLSTKERDEFFEYIDDRLDPIDAEYYVGVYLKLVDEILKLR